MNNLNGSNNQFIISEEEKKSVLKEHMLVYIKHPRVYEGMLNRIEKYDGENIYIKATEPFLNNSIFIDDGVICQVFTSDYEYLSYGRITDIGVLKFGLVRINIHEVHRFINIRRDKRYLVNLCCNVADVKNNGNYYAIIKNISRNGLNIVCKDDFDKGSVVDIEFTTDESKIGLIRFKAKILRLEQNTGYKEYGLEIRDIDDASSSALGKLLHTLEEDEKYAFSPGSST